MMMMMMTVLDFNYSAKYKNKNNLKHCFDHKITLAQK
jgi:hypothetical protein